VLTLVAGTGYTGSRVLERLPLNSAIGLSRSPIETTRPFHTVDFDALDALPLALPARYAVLYTCPPGPDGDARLRRFLAALTPAPSRFVYISTTGVYGDCGGAVVTEQSPVNAQSRMAKPRVAAEEILADWAAHETCELVVLRVPGIYGPGRLGIERIREGGPSIAAAEASPGNRIHVDDLASCCIAALNDRTPAGVYNVGDGDHRSATWFADEVARQAGLAEPPQISRKQAQEAFSPTRLAFLAASRVVDTTRMRRVLGVTPRSPEQGIRDSLASTAESASNAARP
jgi:nucleoside-diphosphate-sugar epimerase